MSEKKNPRLNQIIAVLTARKNQSQKRLTDLYKMVQRPDAFTGMSKVYTPRDEDGVKFPTDSKRVQFRAKDVFDRAEEILTDFFDLALTQDSGNQVAKADVVVGGETIATDVPVSTLLFFEKQLTDMRTLITNVPTLDPAHEWDFDDNSGLYRTKDEIISTKTQKVAKPIVLHPPTKEHPAQTEMVTEDQVVGDWHTTYLSGAISQRRRDQLLQRVDKLIDAVKTAREEANAIEVEQRKVGNKLMAFLFSE